MVITEEEGGTGAGIEKRCILLFLFIESLHCPIRLLLFLYVLSY